MADIIFVNPYAHNLYEYSIGVLRLVSVLEMNKYDCEIFDIKYYLMLNNKNNNTFKEYIDDIIQYLLSKKPKIIGFSCMSNNYHFILKLAKEIKMIDENIKIMLGGPQATITAEQTIKRFKYIDMISLGEGENCIVNQIDFLLNTRTSDEVESAIFYDGNKLIKKNNINLIENLDSLPLLEYHKIPYFENIDIISIETGRGCPFSCIFCSTKSFWKQKARLRSIDSLVKEIKFLKNTYGKSNFTFIHDLFTVRKSFILDFCNRLIEENLKISWSCSSRIDTIDEEMLYVMNKSGCRDIFFGVETGSERIQKLINKNLKLETLEKLLVSLRKYGFKNSTFSFIYSFPFETEDDICKTLKMIWIIMNKYDFNIHLGKCNILVGTQLYNDYKDNIEFTGTFSMISDDIFLNDCIDIIKENKDIFPQYYNFNTPFHQKYDLLEKFFMFYTTCKKSFKGTYLLLNAYFENDILKFYESFVKYEETFIRNFFNVIYITEKKLEIKENNYKTLKIIADFLKNYINKYINEKYKILISDMIQYEYLLCDIYTQNVDFQEIILFDFDVSAIRRNFNFIQSLDEISEKRNKITLIKTKENIKIKKKYI